MGNAGVRAVGNVVGVVGELPEASGPLRPVGSLHARVPGACIVRVLYPCEGAPGGAAATRGYTREVVVRHAPYVFKNVRNTRHYLREGARVRAPPTPATRYPVFFFSHGLKGSADVYSKIASEIASHGLVVLCLEHEDGSASVRICVCLSPFVPTDTCPSLVGSLVSARFY
jgi:hypothetical protein